MKEKTKTKPLDTSDLLIEGDFTGDLNTNSGHALAAWFT